MVEDLTFVWIHWLMSQGICDFIQKPACSLTFEARLLPQLIGQGASVQEVVDFFLLRFAIDTNGGAMIVSLSKFIPGENSLVFYQPKKEGDFRP